MYYSTANVSVDELTGRGLMSVRAMNICKRSRLFDFKTIYAHYQTHGGFATLPQMGKKTNESLVELCNSDVVQTQLEDKPGTPPDDHHLAQPKQPQALIAAYLQIPEINRPAAEQIYGNLVCSLSRRAIRALLNLYKSKSLAGLINGLEVKPSAFVSLAAAMLPTGTDLNGFLDKLTHVISGDRLTDTIRSHKLHLLSHQIAQITRKPDEQTEAFLAKNIDELETGNFPLSDFIDLLIRCDKTLKPDYRTAVLLSDLFYRRGLPFSKELPQKLNTGVLKIKRLYRHNGYHQSIYTHVTQSLRILQSQGLVTPKAFLLKEVSCHNFPNGLPEGDRRFTNRMLAPLFSCFNPDFRLFYQPGILGDYTAFVHKKTEDWFDTLSFFGMIEKKSYLRSYADEDACLMKLLSAFCRRMPSEDEWTELFAFARPLLKQRYQHQIQPYATRKTGSNGRRPVRYQLIYDFIKSKDRHCHIDEIRTHLIHNGQTVPLKSLFKYLEKCNVLIKPVGQCLFQLREWDNQNRWQEETVLQLATHFLSAHPAPQPLYAVCKHVMRYKNTDLAEVTDVLLHHTGPLFTTFCHRYFGLAERTYHLPFPASNNLPDYWQDVARPLFNSANGNSIRKEDLLKLMMQRYKLTKAKSLMIVDSRVRMGEWNETEDGKLLLPANAL